MQPNAISMKRNNRVKIVVAGYIVRGPLGGLAWHHLQYVASLCELGFDVVYIEDSGDYPACFDPSTCTTGSDATYGLAFAKQCFKQLNLENIWTYYDASERQWTGPAASKVLQFIQDADLLLNLSGLTPTRDWLSTIPARALVDTDPLFTQVKLKQDAAAMQHALWHNAFFSYAENINDDSCTIPLAGINWQTTRQPVLLSKWNIPKYRFPHANQSNWAASFTTVMQWESYAICEHAGQHYGMKSASFPPFWNLPQRLDNKLGIELEVAIGGDSAPIDKLHHEGWRIKGAMDVTRTLSDYQRYIESSAAEFSVAKHGYCASRSGWFSERSANYLAASRPVIVQDTGFEKYINCGAGLLTFSDSDEAIEAIEAVASNYEFHANAAKEVACAYFSPVHVLRPLVDGALSSSSRSTFNDVRLAKAVGQ